MEYRVLGKTGLKVSAIGFGCGGVGGLMLTDNYPLMMRAVERAVEAGINYFDTAQAYGSGRSEENLGQVLHVLKPDVIVGTKVQLSTAEMNTCEASVIQAAERSLQRLQLEQLDLFQLHNPIGFTRNPDRRWVGLEDLQPVVQAFHKLQQAGKIRYWGINGLGDTEAIHRGVAESGADTIQVCFNLLNPSAAYAMPAGFPFQDHRQVIELAAKRQAGVIAFRILAGGALTAIRDRHPVAARAVDPVASSSDYEQDVLLALRFQSLVSNGWASSVAEAALRFALNQPGIATALIGFSSMGQLDQALATAAQGPLSQAALNHLPEVWQQFARG